MELCNELTIQFCQESLKQGHANKVLSVLLTLRDHKQLQFFQQISDPHNSTFQTIHLKTT